MEQDAIDAFTIDIKRDFIEALGLTGMPVRDLGGFESFLFAIADKILRITHLSHRSPEQIMAELEFVNYLSEKGASVCAPKQLANRQWVLNKGDFTACLFDTAQGKPLGAQDWVPDVIREWGECIGQFHALSVNFQPTHRRIDWRADENHSFSERIPADQSELVVLANKLMKGLEELPVSKRNYGLIHGDAHAGNFFATNDRLMFFDFDDAIYTWFTYDIATILFGAVLAKHLEPTRKSQEEMARYFLPHFLEGYNKSVPVDSFVLDEMSRFLKLREFSLYAVIHTHMDVNNLTDWYPARFMAGRRERLENEEPYLDLDFSSFK